MLKDYADIGFLDEHATNIYLKDLGCLTWHKGWVPPTTVPN